MGTRYDVAAFYYNLECQYVKDGVLVVPHNSKVGGVDGGAFRITLVILLRFPYYDIAIPYGICTPRRGSLIEVFLYWDRHFFIN